MLLRDENYSSRSEVEKQFCISISSANSHLCSKGKLPTPWLSILKSGPIWGCIAAHMLNNYTNYTLLTSLPMFMKEVLKFDISKVTNDYLTWG